MKNVSMYMDVFGEVQQLGAKDMDICMQCGSCSASCPLSKGEHPFPRKIYRYLQLGLRDKLLSATEPWLCYYCGECNARCPRGAEPAETMMAVRRWLTIQYDWTGLAKRFYTSAAWEFGALGVVALAVVLLFTFFHGPVITDRVSVNSFAPVFWVEVGDLLLATALSLFLLSNAVRMYRYIMEGVKVPMTLFLTEMKTFVVHFATQKRWRQCGDDRSRWLKHFLLVSGYLTMLTLIIVFLRWFQVDDSSWHFSSLFGYYATGVLLYVTVEMFLSRIRRQEMLHRYSHMSDWLFLVLLFFTTLTGLLMHLFRIGGWPMGTYVMYVVHLAIAVPMLVIEVPFGKWSHLFYRPFAVFLAGLKDKVQKPSAIDFKQVKEEVTDAFTACMHCGICTTVCPTAMVAQYSPRLIMRHVALDRATDVTVDEAGWSCLTCDACTTECPRGIGVLDVVKAIRRKVVDARRLPRVFHKPLDALSKEGTPWEGMGQKRLDWSKEIVVPQYQQAHDYCLFTCCTTAFDTSAEKKNAKAGGSLLRLLEQAGVSYGSLGTREICCGDMADKIGAVETAGDLQTTNSRSFVDAGVKRILTISPHCFNTFSHDYAALGNIEIVHYTELLDRLLEKGVLRPRSRIDRRITYHDPCYLGRANHIYEQPRRILQTIPGVDLVEMQNNRQRSLCCGGGGGGVVKGGLGKETVGEIRLEEAMATGAAVVATACPFCLRMLDEAIRKRGVGDRIEVRDVADLLWESIDASAEKDDGHLGKVADMLN